ncbi:hypothetical protein PRN20_00335 [Devosia sp. ZB163]|uniref:hypothetical protein n=1 Tax=Devosia sp. ZB163 TaxID=3025938 RepID=UPI0023618074|nr:hypothetical protein [Devosia sp. ZB163]MDC9822164.1 hypothetical protein [Devosia sp. ZB163]
MRALIVALALAATPVLAQDAEIEEIRRAWDACTGLIDQSPNEWTGWRRNFDGGYADHFEFHEATDGSGVLVQTWLIDAIATQKDTSCFRKDGTLAFLYSEMTSPNMAQGADGPAITREGRLYFSPDGRLVRVMKRITEAGKEVAPIDNDRYQMARGCELTAPHATMDDVRSHMISELGDIEGTRGEFKRQGLDWCGL